MVNRNPEEIDFGATRTVPGREENIAVTRYPLGKPDFRARFTSRNRVTSNPEFQCEIRMIDTAFGAYEHVGFETNNRGHHDTSFTPLSR